MNKQEISEMVREQAGEYIRVCFPKSITPHQEIEIRLAFYAGMVSMLEAQLNATKGCTTDDEYGEVVLVLSDVIRERAIKLNNEREKLAGK